MDGRTNRGNKAAFSNFSGVLWTGPLIVYVMYNSYYYNDSLRYVYFNIRYPGSGYGYGSDHPYPYSVTRYTG